MFLHGLNGSPKDTWTDETKDGTGFFWPRQVLADIPGCRVMTFGYNAAFERALVKNTTTINAIAQTFVNRLIDKRKGEHVRKTGPSERRMGHHGSADGSGRSIDHSFSLPTASAAS